MKWNNIKEIVTDDSFVIGVCAGVLIGLILSPKRSLFIGCFNSADNNSIDDKKKKVSELKELKKSKKLGRKLK